jgi:membrane-associated protease RseP (regulator of RpoE activity)
MGTPILKAILDTWPSSLVLLGVLGAHELGHQVAAKRHNVKLGVPFFIPGLQLGTFGAITQIKSILPTRSVLIEIAAAGPALGAIVGLGLLLAGLILPPADGVGTVVDASVFHDSFLAGGIGTHDSQSPGYLLSSFCANGGCP